MASVCFSCFISDLEIPFNATACGMAAFAKGRGQKVIGFTFFTRARLPKEALQRYYDGIDGNLKLLHQFYPGSFLYLFIPKTI
jgi:hypothetical protein